MLNILPNKEILDNDRMAMLAANTPLAAAALSDLNLASSSYVGLLP